jgi:hypothetical protein
MKIESIREVKANLNKIVSALPEEGKHAGWDFGEPQLYKVVGFARR